MPSSAEIVDGKVSVSGLRNIQIEDLLGRDPVLLDDAGLHAFLADNMHQFEPAVASEILALANEVTGNGDLANA